MYYSAYLGYRCFSNVEILIKDVKNTYFSIYLTRCSDIVLQVQYNFVRSLFITQIFIHILNNFSRFKVVSLFLSGCQFQISLGGLIVSVKQHIVWNPRVLLHTKKLSSPFMLPTSHCYSTLSLLVPIKLWGLHCIHGKVFTITHHFRIIPK